MFVKVNVRGATYNLSQLVSDQHFKTEYINFEICDVFKKKKNYRLNSSEIRSSMQTHRSIFSFP